jgi:threonine dehydrogenase-like Zn-dependent dehydrogenase
MRAVCWQGANKVGVDTVPDPKIINPRDAVIKITSTAICGSDLHLYDGFIPTMEQGDILGHEFMGEVVEVGSEVKRIKVGDIASSIHSRSPAVTVSSANKRLHLSATTPIPMPLWQKRLWDIHPPAFLATPIC